ncbi:MAG: hypothetical protein AAF604_22210 [Acidobacteriota bacterium]
MKIPCRRLLALFCLFLCLSGCLSVRATGTVASGNHLGGLEVRIFADDDDRRAGILGPRHIEAVLERDHQGGWEPIFRALSPAWSITELPPGRYRLRLPSRLDEAGYSVDLEDAGKIFKVRRGEVTQVEATVEHVPRGLIAAGVVTAVVAGILLHEWLDDHDLPLPPPPPPALVEAAFHITLDLALWATWEGGAPRGPDLAPVVTSHFPEADSQVETRRPRLVFALSEPLTMVDLAAVQVTVDGVPWEGETFYDSETWWVTWEPLEDLPRDAAVEAFLEPSGIADRAGNPLFGEASFTFRTAP